MSANKRLVLEVASVVNGRLERGIIVYPEWLKQEMLSRHSDIHGEDKDWYLVCASDALEVAIKEFLSKTARKEREHDPDEDDETCGTGTFPGFPKIQRGYLVVRAGKRGMIPTAQLTTAELLEKADRYDSMGEGCREHARQLRRFAAERAMEA
jgi:hypothetical protein